MKGIIFNLIEEVVSAAYGDETWDRLLDDVGLDGAYTSLGSYPDDDLFRLVGAASVALETPPNDLVRIIGQGALPLLAQRFPGFFEPHSSTVPFMLTLNDIIHAEVCKLYPGADVPAFDVEVIDDRTLILGYRSERKLCALAEGFILGAAAHYGEVARVEQSECMLEGDVRCVLRCTIAPP